MLDDQQREAISLNSSGVKLLKGQHAVISERAPVACKGERLWISASSTKNGAADWIVEDFKVDDVSWFLKGGRHSW